MQANSFIDCPPFADKGGQKSFAHPTWLKPNGITDNDFRGFCVIGLFATGTRVFASRTGFINGVYFNRERVRSRAKIKVKVSR